MTKLLFTAIFSLLFAGFISAQEVDQRLIGQQYSKSELITLQNNEPKEYEFLIYALDNALYLANYDAAKGDFALVDYTGSESFLELGLEITEQNQYFKVANEDKLLVVKSRWVLTHEMQKQ